MLKSVTIVSYDCAGHIQQAWMWMQLLGLSQWHFLPRKSGDLHLFIAATAIYPLHLLRR